MESRRFNTSLWNFLVVHSILWCACFLVTAVPGAGALKFLNNPEQMIISHTGMDAEFNCTTDDPNATVSLLFSNNFGATWSARSVEQNKLVLRGQVFTLMNLIFVDAGQYKCQANTSGQTVQWTKSVFLFVGAAELPRYFELIPDKSIYVLQGQDGKITCECTGVGIATLKWEKETRGKKSYEAVPDSWVSNIKHLSTNRMESILKIPKAQLADTGVYKCTVMVNQKSDFKLTYIQVIAPRSPRVSPYTGETVIKEGSTKVVKCVASAAPKPTLSWYRNGKKLTDTNCGRDPKSCENIVYEVYEEGDDPSGLHTLFTTQVLKIRSASYPRDNGEFKCVASNGVSPDAELRINFLVQGAEALRFLNDPPQLISSHTGMNAEFNCTTDDPNAAVSLLFSNNFGATWSTRSVSQNKLVLRGQVFTLMNLIFVDAGQYKCKANTSGQTIQWTKSVFLLVGAAELPRYFELIPAKSIYVLQGQDGKVTCECDGVGIATLKWEKETKGKQSYEAVPVSWVTYTKDLATNRVIAVLKIPKAQLADTGVYKCTVMVNQKSDFKLTYIRVKAPGPPTIIPYTGETVITEGSTKFVKCVAKGSPKPSVSWYRNGKKLKTKKRVKDPKTCENDIVYEVYEEGEDTSGLHTFYTVQVLKIQSASYPRDHGEFKCVASNGLLPDAELNIDFHVQVELADHFKLRPGKPITVLQGQEAKLKCESDIDSVTKLQWKKQTYSGDVPVPDSMVAIVKDRSTKRIRAILKIKYADMQDSGVYKCVLTAFGKTDSKQTMITVEESLAFSNKPQDVIQGYLGQNAVINCSTNDDEAAVFLLRKPHPFAPFTILEPEANKLSKKGQVFTILNIDIQDAGIYACAARNRKHQTIQWPRFTGYLCFSRGSV